MRRKTGIRILCGLFLAGVFCLSAYRVAEGFWDSGKAVHMDAASVENSTLFIGTHLIHLSALTDELYEVAKQSAADSMQDHIYYKSELAGGTWFDITNAASLSDISTGGKPVTNQEMEALFAEYHTKSDRITYDLRTGQAVNIFDIVTAYELEKLEELSPLKMQLDLLREKKGEGEEAAWYKKRVEDFFATETHTEETGEADASMDALHVYQTLQKEKKAPQEKLEAVEKVMSHVDAGRRLAVFRIVSKALDSLMEDLNGVTDEKPEEYQTDAGLTDGLNESIGNVQDALIVWEGKSLSEGKTVVSRTEYRLSQSLIEAARQTDPAACDSAADRLAALKAIMDGSINDREKELSLLDETLIGEAENAYKKLLLQGEPEEYQKAAGEGASEAVLNSLLDAYEADLHSAESELEFFLDARILRLSNEEAGEYAKEGISRSAAWSSAIPGEDAFGELAKASAQEHLDWLSERLNSLITGAGGDEADKLAAEKADLQTEYLAALDDNNLARAKELNEELEQLNEKLTAIEQERTERAARLSEEIAKLKKELEETDPGDERARNELSEKLLAGERELAEARAALPAGSLGRQAADLKKEALKLISGGDSPEDQDKLEESAGALMDLLPADYKTVFPLLKEVLDAMERERDLKERGEFDSLIRRMEDIIAANRAAYDSAMRRTLSPEQIYALAEEYLDVPEGTFGTGTPGTGTPGTGAPGTETPGTGTDTGQIGREDGQAASNGLFDRNHSGSGGDPETMKKQVEFLLALSLYAGDTGSEELRSLLAAKLQKARLDGNGLVFEPLNDPAVSYVPVEAVACYAGLRYVWNETKYRADLADRNVYFEFTAFSDRVQTDAGERKMTAPAKFQHTLYLPADFTLEAFGCKAVRPAGSDVGLVADEEMEREAEALFSLFQKGGE